MIFEFTPHQQQKILARFGADMLAHVRKNLAVACERWGLTSLSLVDYFSVNCIFLCRSEQFGAAVLKIGRPCREVNIEVSFLNEYAGGPFCRVYASDVPNGVILLERILPGTRLRETEALEERLLAFTELYRNLHRAPQDAREYPTYLGWVQRIAQFMQSQSEHTALSAYMQQAERLCAALCAEYPKQMLLHGDLHHDNILLGDGGQYRVIDPKGVVGDPVFDLPRFVLNEFYGCDDLPYDVYRTRVEAIAAYFEKNLGVPARVTKQCVFIETAMAHCWNVESGEAPNLREVAYAEAVMRGCPSISNC